MKNRNLYRKRYRKKKDALNARSLKKHRKRAFKGILEHSDLFENFKRREEDLLKFIYKSNGIGVSCDSVRQEFNNTNAEIHQIIKNLIDEDFLIQIENSLYLTSKGEHVAELIYKIHNEIEDYIKGRNISCNAHEMAHILEHRLSEEQIKGMVKASEFKDKGISLPDFKLPSGTIVEVNLKNCTIWTKLVSIGVFPGQKIHILNRTGSNYVIEIKNSKFAIDSSLAEEIYLIP